jgi:hypothetical protein
MRSLLVALVLVFAGALPSAAQSPGLTPRAPDRAAAAPLPAVGAPVDGLERVSAAAIRPVEAAAESEVSFASVFSGLGRELARLPSRSTALTLGIGGALAIAAHPADRGLTERAGRSQPLDRLFEAGGATGSGWAQAGAALGTFVAGRATGNRRVQAVSD